MLEVASRFTVELLYMLHTQCFEQLGQDDAAHGVHAVDGYVEVGLADGLYVNEVERQYAVNMLLIVGQVLAVSAQLVYFGVFESFGFGDAEHFVAFFLIQELSFFVQQLQGVPLLGVVRSGEDDTTTGTFHRNGQFSGRCGSQVDVDNVPSHTHQGTYHYVLYHFAGETGITAYYDLVAFYGTRFADECSISRCEFHDVKRVESLACTAANRSADSRDRFD